MCTCKPGTNLPSALALLACTCSVAHTALACRRSHAALPPAHHPQARALTLLTPYPASNTFQSDRVSVLLEIQRSNACGNATAILALALQHRIAPASCAGRIRSDKQGMRQTSKTASWLCIDARPQRVMCAGTEWGGTLYTRRQQTPQLEAPGPPRHMLGYTPLFLPRLPQWAGCQISRKIRAPGRACLASPTVPPGRGT